MADELDGSRQLDFSQWLSTYSQSQSQSSQPTSSQKRKWDQLCEGPEVSFVSSAQSTVIDASQNSAAIEPAEFPGSGRLCHRCKRVDLDSVFQRKVSDKNGEFIASLGRFPKSPSELQCPLCRLVSEMIESSSGAGSASDGSAEYGIRAFASGPAIGGIARCRNARLIPDVAETAVLGIARLDYSGSRRQRKSTLLGGCGYICPTALPMEASESRVLAQAIQPESIDMETLKGWIEFCCTHHPKTCVAQEHGTVDSLRVIDCGKRAVVQAPLGCKYVAMSYVWGPKDQDASSCSVCHDTGRLPEDLPTVVDDAMAVVRSLGLQYLWVDRYCIWQDSEVDKAAQMKVMDIIYNNAHLTIVAAAGIDSSYGLPGVGARRRVPQPNAKIGDIHLVSTLPDSQETVKASRWMTRAWVYQEALFSIRRLIFTSRQLYFECNNMHCCETVSIPLSAYHTLDKRSFRTSVRHGLFRGGFGKRCWPLTSHIEKYSSRSLTYQSDILRAMLGIFRAFEESASPIHQLWGVPIEFDLDLTSRKSQPRLLRQYKLHPWKLAMSFARGLTWLLKYPVQRRGGFPSWSWTGWTGPLREWPSFEPLSAQENPEVAFRVREGGGRTVALHERWEEGMDGLAVLQELEVQAWTFETRIKLTSGGDFPGSGSSTEASCQGGLNVDYLVSITLDDGTDVSSPLYLSKRPEDSDFQNWLLEPPWTFLLLGYRKQASRSPIGLVIDDSGTTAERIGLVDFWNSWSRTEGEWCRTVVDDRQIQKTRRTIRLG